MGRMLAYRNARFFVKWAGDRIDRWQLLEGMEICHKNYGCGYCKEVYGWKESIRLLVQFDDSLESLQVSKVKPYLLLPTLPKQAQTNSIFFRIKRLVVHSKRDVMHPFPTPAVKSGDTPPASTQTRIPRFKPQKSTATTDHSHKRSEIPLSIEQRKIRDIVLKRHIKEVMHFTRFENLENILKHGLLPRKTLNERHIPYIAADSNRYDGLSHASCLSISFPNYRMFYQLRQEQKDVNWIILSFYPEVLWQYECAFYPRNAAKREMCELPLASRKQPRAFAELFEDIPGVVRRAQLNIPDYYTTDPQAEVVVFSMVPVSTLQRIYVNDTAIKHKVETIASNIGINVPCSLDKRLFGPRQDHEFWSDHGNKQKQDEEDDYDEVPF